MPGRRVRRRALGSEGGPGLCTLFLCVWWAAGVGLNDYANAIQVDAVPSLWLCSIVACTGKMIQKGRGKSPTIRVSPYGGLRADKMGETFVVRDAVGPEAAASGIQGHAILSVEPRSDRLRRRSANWLRRQAAEDAASELKTGVGSAARIGAALGIR